MSGNQYRASRRHRQEWLRIGMLAGVMLCVMGTEAIAIGVRPCSFQSLWEILRLPLDRGIMPSSWWKSAAIIIGGACAFLMPSALSGAHGIPRETGLISPLVICLIIQACATAGAYPTRWIETSNHHVLHALGAATLVFVLVTLLRRMIHSPSERTVKRGLTLVLISNVLAFAVIVDLLNNTGSRSCPGGTMERPSSAAYDDTWL